MFCLPKLGFSLATVFFHFRSSMGQFWGWNKLWSLMSYTVSHDAIQKHLKSTQKVEQHRVSVEGGILRLGKPVTGWRVMTQHLRHRRWLGRTLHPAAYLGPARRLQSHGKMAKNLLDTFKNKTLKGISKSIWGKRHIPRVATAWICLYDARDNSVLIRLSLTSLQPQLC